MGRSLPHALANIPTIRFAIAPSTKPLSNSEKDFIHLCSNGLLKQALHRFRPLLWSDPNLFSHLLRCCLSLPCLRQLHAFIIASGAASHRFTANHLIQIYSQLGQPGDAHVVFDTMPVKNAISLNILIGGLMKSGEVDSARKVFDQMPGRNVATWNVMIAGLSNYGLNEKSLEFFVRMRREGMRPDEFTFSSVLRVIAELEDVVLGRQLHGHVVQSGFESATRIGSVLAHMYMSCGSLKEGEAVFARFPSLNIVSCNTIIAGRANNGNPEGALEYFTVMKSTGFEPNEVTFISVMNSCCDLGVLCQGQQFHAQTIKAGADSVVPIRSSLVNMYSKCGSLIDSERVFSESNIRDLVIWSSMIAAYGYHGKGQKAIDLFEEKVGEGTEPSEVTFLSLLYACSHSGLKDEGMMYFDLMTKKYGLNPDVKHYTCIVDLLGRYGCLDEAESFINSMLVKADPVIWKTLLSACKKHKDVQMAERIARHVLRLDPGDSASYVMLSNMRAGEHRWGQVSELRRSMWEKRVRKEPGISWVEVVGRVHQFCTGDVHHPRQSEIDLCLREIMKKITELGYVPGTSTVLHDTEEEEREHSLFRHSEKLAIAFALVSLPPGAPIRVMKNLRMCEDCHVAIKLMSRVIVGREIVVRDSSRFHHFKDGECSCKDYW